MTGRFYTESSVNSGLRCTLCPHHCGLLPGKAGLCRVRWGGQKTPDKPEAPELPYYGYITALALDPVEKKPLYHWRPGSAILSAGFAGCNLRCPFCQNWRISQSTEAPGRYRKPEDLTEEAAASLCDQIAYTYSEPLVHAEYLLDCMKAARDKGFANILVTNGCVSAEAAKVILSHTNAVNVDLKCFSQKTYSEVLGGDLWAVLDFIRLAVTMDVHTEITTLVVPGLNDGEKELTEIAEFIAGLAAGSGMDAAVPWHLSAYHPDWKWKTPVTNAALLSARAARARKILPYVYTGNIPGEHNDTHCPHCKAVLVQRRGYSIDTSGIILEKENGTVYRCAHCGKKAPIAG